MKEGNKRLRENDIDTKIVIDLKEILSDVLYLLFAFVYFYDIVDIPNLPISELFRIIEQTEIFVHKEFKQHIWSIVSKRREISFGRNDCITSEERAISISFAVRYKLKIEKNYNDYHADCIRLLNTSEIYHIISMTSDTVTTKVGGKEIQVKNPYRWGCAIVWIATHLSAEKIEISSILSLIDVKGITADYLDVIYSYRLISYLKNFIMKYTYQLAQLHRQNIKHTHMVDPIYPPICKMLTDKNQDVPNISIPDPLIIS